MSGWGRYLCAAMLVACAPGFAAEPRAFTDSQWRDDIETFCADLRKMHLKPFHAVPEPDFDADVQQLIGKLSQLSDEQIALELTRIVARVGDGHTWIAFGDKIVHDRLPVEFFEFAEGVYVTAAMPGFERYIGARLESIGGVDAATLFDRASPYSSHDNEWSLRDRRVAWLGNFVFLEHVGAAKVGGAASVVLKDRDGRAQPVDFARVPWALYLEWAKHPVRDPDAALPLCRRQPDKPYWMEYLKKDHAVYVKFNSVTNDPDGPHLARFSEEMIALVESKKARKLIIDVRDNGGGNGDMLKPFIRRVAENGRVNQPGRLFVITGRATFSAALMFTVRMERQTHAIFAGEPGGGKPNSYSERTNFSLPNSGMRGSISSRYHEEGEPGDTREFVPVTISVPPTAADYFGKRDSVLDAVLAYKAK